MSEEFGRVVHEYGLGVPLEAALGNLLKRNPSTDLDLTITTINVSHATGGKLAEVLDKIAGTIRDRMRVASEIRAMTSQQRLSALILTFLPAVVGLIVFAMNPDYLAPLWQSSCGLALLGAGVLLVIMGNIVIKRVIEIQY
jgi:tight adherence protein B